MPKIHIANSEDGDPKCSTFIFEDEGHTLGNALRCIICNYKHISFCGYTIPHPAESKMYFRIQVTKGTAVEALTQGLQDLAKLCDHTLLTFDKEIESYKAQFGMETT